MSDSGERATRISVVIPAWNAERFLGAALESVIAQTHPADEVIVVDDGSTDATRAIAARFPGVRLLAGARGGPAAARNRGIAAASGHWIALLDADDRWRKDKLARQLDAAERDPAAVLIATLGETLGSRLPVGRPAPTGGLGRRDLVLDNGIITSSVLLRRLAFERVGGFDEDPELISVEDYDLWLRLAGAGRLLVLDEPLVERREHDSNLSRDHVELYRRALRVIEKLARDSDAGDVAEEVAARRGQLHFLVGRGLLARGETLAAREHLRRARQPGSRHRRAAVLLGWLAHAPAASLRALHWLRESGRGRR